MIDEFKGRLSEGKMSDDNIYPLCKESEDIVYTCLSKLGCDKVLELAFGLSGKDVDVKECEELYKPYTKCIEENYSAK